MRDREQLLHRIANENSLKRSEIEIRRPNLKTETERAKAEEKKGLVSSLPLHCTYGVVLLIL